MSPFISVMLQVPLPTPFTIPTPDPASVVIGDPLWDVNNLGGGLSALQTVFVMAEQYYLISMLFVIGSIIASIMFLSKMVSGRGSNV